jgi:aspartyl-tRNA(Asn)/glutamyl-tRNA(Gln) amidotransferase subunit C
MTLSRHEIQEVAQLARLDLSEAELVRLEDDLGAILASMAQLATLDTSGIEPTTHALPLDCPLREDVIEPSLPIAEVTAAAPASVDGFFSVPQILDISEPPR